MSNKKTKESVTVPMYIEEGVDVKEYGLNPNDIRTLTIGGRKIRVVYVQCEPWQKEGLMKLFWHRVNIDKKARRDARCPVQGKYGAIRCPDGKRCEDCEYGRSLDRKNNSVVSLDAMLEDGGYEPAARHSPQNDLLIEMILDELVDYLEEIHPRYGEVFRFLYAGTFNRRIIGEALGIPTGTVKSWIPKIQRLAEEYYMDR